MIEAASFITQAREVGFQLYSGVPCSYLKPFINYVIDSPDLDYIGATNEGDAVAIASGAALAGQRAVVMFQNSGFGNAVNPLTSLNAIFRIPVLILVTWRGEPGGEHDEPQHELMGQITPGLFDLMGIRWEFFPQHEDAIGLALDRAIRHMDTTHRPFGLIMKKDSVAPHPLKSKPQPLPLAPTTVYPYAWPAELPTRSDVLRVVRTSARPTDAIIATTGYTGRELYALGDDENQLYMVGSMGCAASLGLGLAWRQRRRRVLVLDGDGAVLMRLGALATLGYQSPPNLTHLVLDNEGHDSTGGQSTVSHSVDLAAIAQASGYRRVIRTSSLHELGQIVAEAGSELTFIHIKIRPGTSATLPRPTIAPWQVAERFRAWIQRTSLA
jgi:phosphonopyruvate decarboxylase